MKYEGYTDAQKIFIQLAIDYYITFGYCIGTGLLALYYGLKEQDKRKKHLFYYAIVILNFSIVAAYLIDFVTDPLFGTTKVIWAIIFTTILTLCIYLFKVRL
jgi:predicted permease